MVSLSACSPHDQTDELFKALLKQRSQPYVIVLDADLHIAFADRNALALLQADFQPDDPKSTLPPSLQDSIDQTIARLGENRAASEALMGAVNGFVLRVVPLPGLHGTFYAIFFEKEARREDLKEAVTRFSFTPREVEVLDLILRGMNAAEIAEDLHIAEVTVFDHFKHISHKTNARNRADMVAKIFNWQATPKREGRGESSDSRQRYVRREGR